MAADLNLTLNGTPVPVFLGENATLALAQANRAEAAADRAEDAQSGEKVFRSIGFATPPDYDPYPDQEFAAEVALDEDGVPRLLQLREPGQPPEVFYRRGGLKPLEIPGEVAEVIDIALDGDGAPYFLEQHGRPEHDFATAGVARLGLVSAGAIAAVHDFDRVRNTFREWHWNYPAAVQVANDRFFTSVKPGDPESGTLGAVAVAQAFDGSRFNDVRFGRQRAINTNGSSARYTDDHNNGVALLDLRPGARWPLILFQADHNTDDVRMWKCPTMDAATATEPADVFGIGDAATFSNGCAYPSAFRNPANSDHCYLLCRQGGSQNANWLLAETTDNWATWRTVQIIADSKLYMTPRLAADGSGVHMLCHQRFNESTGTGRITYVKLGWDGSISASGGEIAADVWDDEYEAIAPLSDAGADVLLDPANANDQNWLTDAYDAGDGTLHVFYTQADRSSFTAMRTTSINYYAVLDLSDGTSAHHALDSTPGSAGNTFENDAWTERSYWPGGAIIGPYEVVVGKWDWTNGSAESTGTGTLSRWVSADSGATWTEHDVTSDVGLRHVRPIAFQRITWTGDGGHAIEPTRAVVHCETRDFTDFYTWDADSVVTEY